MRYAFLISILLIFSATAWALLEYNANDEIKARLEACHTFKAKKLRQKCLKKLADQLDPIKRVELLKDESLDKHLIENCAKERDKQTRLRCYAFIEQIPSSGPDSPYYRLAEKAIADVKMQPRWQKIEIKRASKTDYSLVIWYKSPPSGQNVVEKDTKLFAKHLLNGVQKSGVDPQKQYLGIYVRGNYKAGRSETRRKAMHYGRTHYDFKHHRFIYTPSQ